MECEKKEFQLQAVCFAAGTAVFIACLERAVVLSFMEQWRVLMFLALNLLLLAILFTSTNPILSKEGAKDGTASEEKLKAAESKKQRKQHHQSVMVCFADKENKDADRVTVEVDVKREEISEAEVKEQAFNQLSMEELNERVDAFIATFRQHLISDNAKGRSCRQLHSSLFKNQSDYLLPKQFR